MYSPFDPDMIMILTWFKLHACIDVAMKYILTVTWSVALQRHRLIVPLECHYVKWLILEHQSSKHTESIHTIVNACSSYNASMIHAVVILRIENNSDVLGSNIGSKSSVLSYSPWSVLIRVHLLFAGETVTCDKNCSCNGESQTKYHFRYIINNYASYNNSKL